MKLAIIQQSIFEVRGVKVMFDFDLAELYGVETKRLNEQVKRNLERFPEDFMFRLTAKEWDFLRSQFVTSSWKTQKSNWSQFATSSKKHKQEFTFHVAKYFVFCKTTLTVYEVIKC